MKRALVTGASGALGAAICRRLAADGCHVYAHANANLHDAEGLSREINSGGGSAQAVAFDVTDHAQAGAALQELLSGGPIQIIVNNAGIHDDAVMAGMRADQWARVIAVSLNGFFNVTQPLLMAMIGTRWGRIINMSSVAALTGNRGQANYAAAKAGLHGATKSLARELASRGITVNAIAPGVIASPMSSAAFNKSMIDELVPMKRAGTPEEVADLAAYLASERSAYISGQVISINGAMI